MIETVNLIRGFFIRHSLCVCLALVLVSPTSHALWSTVLEAEVDTTVIAPASVVEEDGARHGQAVMLSSPEAPDSLPLGTGSVARGELEFACEAPQAAPYALWVRLQWHCTCSASFYVITDTPLTISESPRVSAASAEQSTLEARINIHPRVWRWVRLGVWQLQKGRNRLRFLQQGHLALIDAIAVADDLSYVPPGHSEEETFSHSGEDLEWKEAGASRFTSPLGERDRESFQFDAVLEIPEHAATSSEAFAGLAFCSDGHGSCYELSVSRTGASELSVVLDVLKANSRTRLAQVNYSRFEGNEHLVRVIKLGSTIKAGLNGVPILEVQDDTFAAGKVSLLAHTKAAFRAKEILLQDIPRFEENYTSHGVGWKVQSGKWSIFSEGTDGTTKSTYLCRSENSGLSLAPWMCDDAFGLGVHVRVMGQGLAGIAYDVVDPHNYSAFVLAHGSRNQGDSLQPRVLRVSQGRTQTIWSKDQDVASEQWHALGLVRHPRGVSLRLDGETIGSLSAPPAGAGQSVGLTTGDAATASFSSFKAFRHTPMGDRKFIFEPYCDSRSLSQWCVKMGRAVLVGHPAKVQLWHGREGEARMRLYRHLNGDFRISVNVTDQTQQDSLEPLGPNALPDLVLPVLPDSPRIGISITSLGASPTSYSVSTDAQDMRDIVILKNASSIRKAMAESPIKGANRILTIQKEGTKLLAGIEESTLQTVENCFPSTASDEYQIEIFTSNHSPLDFIEFPLITLDETPAPLAEAPSP